MMIDLPYTSGRKASEPWFFRRIVTLALEAFSWTKLAVLLPRFCSFHELTGQPDILRTAPTSLTVNLAVPPRARVIAVRMADFPDPLLPTMKLIWGPNLTVHNL